MNELRVFARFQGVPSSAGKRDIIREIHSFFQKIDPDMQLEEKSGTGSWWIDTKGTTQKSLYQSVSRGFGRILDGPEPSQSCRSDSGTASGGENDRYEIALPAETIAGIICQMNELGNRISEYAAIDTLKLGGWSEAKVLGWIAILNLENQEFRLIYVDDKNAFDMNFG